MPENPFRKSMRRIPEDSSGDVVELPHNIRIKRQEGADSLLNLISNIKTLSAYPGDSNIKAENGYLKITYDSDEVMLISTHLLGVGYGERMSVEGNTIVIKDAYQPDIYADEEIERIVRHAFFDQLP